jgi:malonate transporter and related proteins
MLSVLAAILPVFALIGVGFLFGRLRRIDARGIAVLNAFTVWLALPAILFQSLAEGDWALLDQPGFITAVGSGIAITFILGLLFIPVPTHAPHRFADRTLVALTASYSNTAFLGIPLLQGMLGQVGLAAAVIGSMLTVSLLFTTAVLLIEIGLNAGHGLAGSYRRVATAVIRNPLIMAPIAGALWAASNIPVPVAGTRFLSLLGAAASPCALVTIGAFLALPRTTRISGGASGTSGLAHILVLKLVVQPGITAACILLLLPRLGLGLTPEWRIAAVLLTALPIGTGPFMLAELYGREAGLASRAVLLSTIIGTVTILLIAFVLRT